MDGMVATLTVQYPEWREQIINSVRALSDVDRQRRVWVEGERLPTGLRDSLDYRIHVLFDDGDLLPDPADHLGVTLESQAEVDALRPLGIVLDDLIDALGDVSDAEYLADPRWTQVVERAASALKVLTKQP